MDVANVTQTSTETTVSTTKASALTNATTVSVPRLKIVTHVFNTLTRMELPVTVRVLMVTVVTTARTLTRPYATSGVYHTTPMLA